MADITYNEILGGLRLLFTNPEDEATIQQLASFIDEQILNDISPSEIEINLRNTSAYKSRFAGNEALKAAGFNPLSEAEYLQQESTYTEALVAYGLGNLATRSNFASLIGGNVSPAELTDRIINVYDRINNADDALANELRGMKDTFGLRNSDLASALLSGKEGAATLKRQIAQAEIGAEATTRGLKSALGTSELQKLGVNRQQAAQGFEAVRQTMGAAENLANIYGVQTNDLQKQLEQEQFQGLESQKRKQLAQKQVEQFSGQSGNLTGQNIKSVAGNF